MGSSDSAASWRRRRQLTRRKRWRSVCAGMPRTAVGGCVRPSPWPSSASATPTCAGWSCLWCSGPATTTPWCSALPRRGSANHGSSPTGTPPVRRSRSAPSRRGRSRPDPPTSGETRPCGPFGRASATAGASPWRPTRSAGSRSSPPSPRRLTLMSPGSCGRTAGRTDWRAFSGRASPRGARGARGPGSARTHHRLDELRGVVGHPHWLLPQDEVAGVVVDDQLGVIDGAHQ